MNIENNKLLFLACVGLIASGSDGYSRDDADVSRVVGYIHAAGLPGSVKEWFARARTGQVKVNPYWPRGSCLTCACFFVSREYCFDKDLFFAFLESTGVINDPISVDDLKAWISEIEFYLRLVDEHPATPALWNEYCRIVSDRSSEWREMIEKAVNAAQAFFGKDAPEMVFSPNLFTPCSADFVRIGNRIITISSSPDAETMLHETMHTAIAKHRAAITDFATARGLAGFANKTKMLDLGYMENELPSSIAHAIEECFVRAFSTVLPGGKEERLQLHACYGFDSVPLIASGIKCIRPSYQTLESFVKTVLNAM